MYQTGVLVLPPLLPVAPLLGFFLTELLGVRYIADGRVEPYVEYLTVGPLDGYGDTPVEVAGHRTGLQVHVEPRLALAIYVRTPLFMFLEDPLLQPVLIVVQGQIPVLRLLQYGSGARDGRFRVDQFRRREVTSALLTLIAVGVGIATMGALASDVAVGEKLLSLFVIELRGGLLCQLTFVVEFAEPVGGKLMMGVRGRAAIDIEGDTELLETLLDHLVVAIYHILWGDALLTGTDGDGHTVFIRSTDEQHFALLQAKIAHIDISRHIHTSQMTDMHTAVGIG